MGGRRIEIVCISGSKKVTFVLYGTVVRLYMSTGVDCTVTAEVHVLLAQYIVLLQVKIEVQLYPGTSTIASSIFH